MLNTLDKKRLERVPRPPGAPVPTKFNPGAPSPAVIAGRQANLERAAAAAPSTGLMPNATAGFKAAMQPVPGEGAFGKFGRGLRGVVEAVKAPFEAAGNVAAGAQRAIGDATGKVAAGFKLQPAPPPAATQTATRAAQPPAAPTLPAAPAPAPSAPEQATTPAAPTLLARNPPTVVPAFTGDGTMGRANAAAPGQVALSERRVVGPGTQLNSKFYQDENGGVREGQLPTVGGRPLPGSPLVGADGSVQYDDAWAEKNKDVVARGVSAMPTSAVLDMAVGKAPPQLTRASQAPRGFTAMDRAAQLDGLDRLGAHYRRSQADDKMKWASLLSRGGHFRTAAAKMGEAQFLQDQANDMTANPLVGQFERSNPDRAAALGLEAERMDRGQGLIDAQTEGEQLRNTGLRQDQKQQAVMEALQADLLGDDKTKAAAAATKLAALQGTKAGEPITVNIPIPTGAMDALGQPVMGQGQMLVDRSGKVLFDPRNPQGGQGRLPPGMTEQQVRDEAMASVKAGADPKQVEARLRQYGLSIGYANN